MIDTTSSEALAGTSSHLLDIVLQSQGVIDNGTLNPIRQHKSFSSTPLEVFRMETFLYSVYISLHLAEFVQGKQDIFLDSNSPA